MAFQSERVRIKVELSNLMKSHEFLVLGPLWDLLRFGGDNAQAKTERIWTVDPLF